MSAADQISFFLGSDVFGGGAAARWVGSQEVRRQKATYQCGSDKLSATVDYVGPMSALMANLPTVGEINADFACYNMHVAAYTVKEGDGGSGTMTQHLEVSLAPGNQTFAPLGEPVYEIVWGELNKALETHPACGVLNPDRLRYNNGQKAGDKEPGKKRTWEDWADLTQDPQSDGTPGDYKDGAGSEFDGLFWDLATYQAKRAAGIDSYVVPAPVIRRTLKYVRDPGDVGVNVGKQQYPPAGSNFPKEYVWLCTADSMHLEGSKRSRETEWTGAKKLDSDIYATADA